MKIEYEINKYELLDEAMKIADVVFKPNKIEKEKYHNRQVWSDRAMSGMLVVAMDDNKAVGFALAYPKEKLLHIWNVGVLDEYRGNGIWQSMFDLIKKRALDDKYEAITINTFPDSFANMYRFTIKNGFEEIKRENDPLSNLTKVFLVKKLGA